VGIDQITAQVRYTGGVLEFMDGIEVVLVAVGLFAVTEALYNALYEGRSANDMNKLLKIPKPQPYAGILIFATVGVYGMRQSAFDLYLMHGLGLLGVLMRRCDFPTAPVIVGLILVPLAEAQMRNALSIGEGSWRVFVQGPMSAALLAVVVLVLVTPRLLAWHQRA
jgi:TctA family transporter